MTIRTEPIGYGVIGAGIWGQLHVRVLSEEPHVRLMAVCDLNEKLAHEIARRHQIPKIFTSYEEMLQDPEIEAVSVATPDFAHAGPALAALHSKRHLLIEKPLATSVEESLAIVQASKEAGVTFMVDFHNRWSPPFFTAYNSLRRGDLGELEFVWFRLNDTMYVPTHYISWAAKSSALWFLGPHAVDTVRWLYQDEVREVYAISRKMTLAKLGIDTPDFYTVILQFENGGVATLEHSWILSSSAPSLFDLKCELQGSKGTVFIDTSSNRMVEMYNEQTPQGYPYQPFMDTTLNPVVQNSQVGFATESIRHFVNCIWSGTKPLVGGVDGLRASEILVAAEKSAATGQPVRLVRSPV